MTLGGLAVDFSFDVNVAQLLSPLLLVCVAIVARQVQKGVINHFDQRHDLYEKKVDERHMETAATLNEIKTQTTATNGRLLKVEEATKADHDLLLTLKGAVDTLTTFKKDGPQ